MAVADAMPGANERVRLLVLGPGGILPKHVDPHHADRWEDREIVRFHVPVIVPEGAVLLQWDRDGVAHAFEPVGSVRFLDASLPHLAVNGTRSPRIHLVIDKFLNDELRAMMLDAEAS
jgi:hypothetical protein